MEKLQPLRITQRRPDETHDTPENRFVVAACRRLRSFIKQIRAKWWFTSATPHDLLMLESVDRAARFLLQNDRFRGLEASLRIPAYSRVLQMKHGYRELTELWSGLTQIHTPQFVRLAEAIDLRDVPTLYEFWQFFELADMIGIHLGLQGIADTPQDNYLSNWGLSADFPGIGTLFTQYEFRGKDTYTPIMLRPDFVWKTVDGRMIVLDAKFAMDPGDPEDDGLSFKATTRDITKMHGYRDAIAGVDAALILYPGTIGTFWSADGQRPESTTVELIIERIVNCTLNGIGALPMRPRLEGVE